LDGLGLAKNRARKGNKNPAPAELERRDKELIVVLAKDKPEHEQLNAVSGH